MAARLRIKEEAKRQGLLQEERRRARHKQLKDKEQQDQSAQEKLL
jgi:hypothetical protein